MKQFFMQPVPLTREVRAFLAAYQKVYNGTPKVMVECGARDFMETTLFSELNPTGKIFSFECNPFTLPRCRERQKKLPNVELIEKAVSDQDGTVSFFPTDPEKTETMYDEGNPGASSLFKANSDYTAEKYVQNEITVPTTRLDTFLAEKKIPAIDAMWMDIQGAELMALRGLGERLHDIGMIYTEVEFFEIYHGQPLFPEVKRFMNQQGFKLYTFISFNTYDGDAIFVNTRKVGAEMKLRLLLSNALAYSYHKFKYRYRIPLERMLNLARIPYRQVRKLLGAN